MSLKETQADILTLEMRNILISFGGFELLIDALSDSRRTIRWKDHSVESGRERDSGAASSELAM